MIKNGLQPFQYNTICYILINFQKYKEEGEVKTKKCFVLCEEIINIFLCGKFYALSTDTFSFNIDNQRILGAHKCEENLQCIYGW